MHIVLRMASRTLMSLVLSATATMALAQERPRIPRDADPNDWEAYYDAGVAQLVRDPRAAEQLFTWASRLRPDRAEPLYARWVAYWARNVDDFVKYARGDEKTWRSPAVVRNDSLRERAMRRNPFVHQGLIVAVYDMLPGRFTDDPVTRGWIALGRAELPQALAAFGVAVSKDPKRNSYLRYTRAAA
ncbi:MAG TPA: hypothetical protein VEB19_17265, partial [Gemmatimonadaceae bacterium]|nr:hypothetical protein [Gemmatimonadaceae bacterium]